MSDDETAWQHYQGSSSKLVADILTYEEQEGHKIRQFGSMTSVALMLRFSRSCVCRLGMQMRLRAVATSYCLLSSLATYVQELLRTHFECGPCVPHTKFSSATANTSCAFPSIHKQ